MSNFAIAQCLTLLYNIVNNQRGGGQDEAADQQDEKRRIVLRGTICL